VAGINVRIWPEVHHAYKQVAEKHGLLIGDLFSIVALYTPLLSPATLVYILEEEYDMPHQQAIEVVGELRRHLEGFLKVASQAEGVRGDEEEIQEEVCKE